MHPATIRVLSGLKPDIESLDVPRLRADRSAFAIHGVSPLRGNPDSRGAWTPRVGRRTCRTTSGCRVQARCGMSSTCSSGRRSPAICPHRVGTPWTAPRSSRGRRPAGTRPADDDLRTRARRTRSCRYSREACEGLAKGPEEAAPTRLLTLIDRARGMGGGISQ